MSRRRDELAPGAGDEQQQHRPQPFRPVTISPEFGAVLDDYSDDEDPAVMLEVLASLADDEQTSGLDVRYSTSYLEASEQRAIAAGLAPSPDNEDDDYLASPALAAKGGRGSIAAAGTGGGSSALAKTKSFRSPQRRRRRTTKTVSLSTRSPSEYELEPNTKIRNKLAAPVALGSTTVSDEDITVMVMGEQQHRRQTSPFTGGFLGITPMGTGSVSTSAIDGGQPPPLQPKRLKGMPRKRNSFLSSLDLPLDNPKSIGVPLPEEEQGRSPFPSSAAQRAADTWASLSRRHDVHSFSMGSPFAAAAGRRSRRGTTLQNVAAELLARRGSSAQDQQSIGDEDSLRMLELEEFAEWEERTRKQLDSMHAPPIPASVSQLLKHRKFHSKEVVDKFARDHHFTTLATAGGRSRSVSPEFTPTASALNSSYEPSSRGLSPVQFEDENSAVLGASSERPKSPRRVETSSEQKRSSRNKPPTAPTASQRPASAAVTNKPHPSLPPRPSSSSQAKGASAAHHQQKGATRDRPSSAAASLSGSVFGSPQKWKHSASSPSQLRLRGFGRLPSAKHPQQAATTCTTTTGTSLSSVAASPPGRPATATALRRPDRTAVNAETSAGLAVVETSKLDHPLTHDQQLAVWVQGQPRHRIVFGEGLEDLTRRRGGAGGNNNSVGATRTRPATASATTGSRKM